MARQAGNITTLPRSPDDDRRLRMIKYTVTMCIRLVCIALCLVVQGWWLVACIAGAVILPYVAVVLANAVDSKTVGVERPGTIARIEGQSESVHPEAEHADPTQAEQQSSTS
ncbi:MAG: DUF3099 domain-containing protein [Cryobacterium sp.]|jgi:hypothetical protein|nr:DUF3099 domain-containing protein [Cryobacterium sp.]